jgi:site-specific DNA-methyltransferase (adenine-specific)
MTNYHPTIKPIKLMSYLAAPFSRLGDAVLDPFVGSGTTCLAAAILSRKGIGIEQSGEYVEIAQARMETTC